MKMNEQKIMDEVKEMLDNMVGMQVNVLNDIVDVLEITRMQLAIGESVVALKMLDTTIDTIKNGITQLQEAYE
tara:strand:+ start:10663 stop:10881 length:219 start_codon:yes stop_codon:yes gene_type:complete